MKTTNRLLRITLVLLSFLFYNLICLASEEDSLLMIPVWISDKGDGTYTNPIIYADYSDPDVVKVGDDFYMVSSSFNCVPGLPVLHSKDLVNWTIIGHVFNYMPPDGVYDAPGHGLGVWAPSIRYHNGEFYVCYGDPDFGIYMAKATNPEGPWDLQLIHPALGWIDPCPFWDDNDSAYIVHAYAKSRTGYNSILTIRRMSRDGDAILGDSTMLFDGRLNNEEYKTIEGPKMYKRNGFYYVFAPYGGVTSGKQAVLRATDVFGPYSDTTALEQGLTTINGPHQGALIELTCGESWFLHFQDKEPYGRITHLQPVEWFNDWPLIGEDFDGNGIGEPVYSHIKPDVGASYPITGPLSSDKFNSDTLGLQWQWHANYDTSWWSLSDNPGNLRLFAVNRPDNYVSLWQVPNLLMQKLPAPTFSMTTKVNLNLADATEKIGFVVMGNSYYYLGVQLTDTGYVIQQVRCSNAKDGVKEAVVAGTLISVSDSTVYLRLGVLAGASCRFSYSFNGIEYVYSGSAFTAAEGGWIGAKAGFFCSRPNDAAGTPGYADFEWFNVDYYQNQLPLAAKNPVPSDKDSVTVDADFSLSWQGDAVFADSFIVYLDTISEPVTMVSRQKTTSFKPSGLQSGKTYYWKVDAKNTVGTTSGQVWSFYVEDIVDVQDLAALSGYSLYQNRPNPFSDFTVFTFSLPETKNICLVLYDLNGRKIQVVSEGLYTKGAHEITFKRGGIPYGVYILKLEVGGNEIGRRILIQ